MNLDKIQELIKDIKKVENKIESKKSRFNEELEMLQIELEDKSDELTKYLNL